MLGVLRVDCLDNIRFFNGLGVCDFQMPILSNRALKRNVLRHFERLFKNVQDKRVSALVVVLAG